MNWIDLKTDTITAALRYPGSVSLVFASHKRPGGGYKNHERGQEEWIARRTNLVDRLQPYLHLYGDNTKPFYIVLDGLKIHGTGETRDFICVPAPLAPRKGFPSLYENVHEELKTRVVWMCRLIHKYPVFITGAWGCGFFGNKLEDVKELFRRHAENETVIFAIK